MFADKSYRSSASLIYSCRDAWGVIEVLEANRVRSLHFGTRPKQSAINLDDPTSLELDYAKAMAAALLFVVDPKRLLIAGLGGGSLATFFLRKFPEAQIDVVEVRPEVVRVARSFFGLPVDPRLRVSVDNFERFLGEIGSDSCEMYDLVLVDVFDESGLPKDLDWTQIVAKSKVALNPNGVLVLNLWDNNHSVVMDIVSDVQRDFNGESFRLLVPGKTNVIYFATKSRMGRRVWKHFSENSKVSLEKHGIELNRYARSIRRI